MEGILCRLCLEMITGDSVELETSERNMMKVLMPDINLDIVDEPRICEKCLEKLNICYGFKASFLGSNENAQKIKLLTEASEDTNENLCLFCNASVFEELGEEESINFQEVVDKCFPNMGYLKKSSTCGSCFNTLKDLYAFTKKCLDTEALISKFAESDHKILLHKVKLNTSPKLEATGEAVPSREETDATKHCVSMKEINAIIGSNVVEAPQEGMLDDENCNKQSLADVCTVEEKPEANRPRGRKRKAPATFSCQECDYVSKHRSALISHKLRHKTPAEVTMFKCTECDHETKRRGDLKAHMKIHLDPKDLPSFQCANCPYSSKRKCDLKQHVIVHMNPSFKCKHCSYTTNNEFYLQTYHVLIHKDVSETEIFVCDVCSYQTPYKKNLIGHIKRQHSSETNTFKCNWCEFSTAYKLNLRKHMILHKSRSECELFKCYSCEYETIRKKDLRDHIFTRHKYRPHEMYHCAHCSFETIAKSRLRKHLLKHRDSSEIPTFSCDLCNFKTFYKYNFQQHKVSHERGNIPIKPALDIQFNSLDIQLAD